MRALSLVVLLVSLGPLGIQESATVPTFVIEEAANPEAIAFGLALIRVKTPCGMEIREEDYDWGYRPDHNRPVRDRRSLREAIEVFERHHPAYRVTADSATVVIRLRTDSLPFLDAPSPVHTATTVIGPLKSLRTVFAAIYPRLTGGVELNTMGYPGWDTKIVLEGGQGRTVLDTLTQIAAQMAGYGWLVTTRKVDGRVGVARLAVLESTGDGQFVTPLPKR